MAAFLGEDPPGWRDPEWFPDDDALPVRVLHGFKYRTKTVGLFHRHESGKYFVKALDVHRIINPSPELLYALNYPRRLTFSMRTQWHEIEYLSQTGMTEDNQPEYTNKKFQANVFCRADRSKYLSSTYRSCQIPDQVFSWHLHLCQ